MKKNSVFKINLVIILTAFFLAVLLATGQIKPGFLRRSSISESIGDSTKFTQEVLPEKGILLPISWANLSQELSKNGVIDLEKIKGLYASQGGYDDEIKELVESANVEKISMDFSNANILLNLLWALGLSNQNKILTEGQMVNPGYGGAEKFASTGGWNLSVGNSMDHYAKHNFIELSQDQQKLVEEVAKNIYRPCCDNPTDFPDCNHGMAMLGLLELMAKNNTSEQEMYRVALQVNSYWFPGYYPVIAEYFATQGISWEKVDPKTALSYQYSSASGFARIKQIVEPNQNSSGAKCST